MAWFKGPVLALRKRLMSLRRNPPLRGIVWGKKNPGAGDQANPGIPNQEESRHGRAGTLSSCPCAPGQSTVADDIMMTYDADMDIRNGDIVMPYPGERIVGEVAQYSVGDGRVRCVCYNGDVFHVKLESIEKGHAWIWRLPLLRRAA